MIQAVSKIPCILSACLCVCTKQFSMCRYRLSIYFLDFVWFWWYYVDKITVTKVPNRIFKGMKLMAGGSIKIGYAKMGYQLHGVLGHLPFCSMFSQRNKPQNGMVPLPMLGIPTDQLWVPKATKFHHESPEWHRWTRGFPSIFAIRVWSVNLHMFTHVWVCFSSNHCCPVSHPNDNILGVYLLQSQCWEIQHSNSRASLRSRHFSSNQHCLSVIGARNMY